MATDDAFKILRLRFLRPPPAFVTLPSESSSRRGWKVPITLAFGVTDDYGVDICSFDSLDLHLQLADPLTSLPLPSLTLTIADSSPPSSSFTLTPSSGPYTTLRLLLSIPPSAYLPPAFRILLAVKPSAAPSPRLSEVSERMRSIIGEGEQDIKESWDGERFVCMRAMSGEVEVKRDGKKGAEASASSEKVQIIYRAIHLPSPSPPSTNEDSSPSLPPLTVVERPGLNNSTGQRLWDCAIGMSCWLSLHPEVLHPSSSSSPPADDDEPPAKRSRPTPSKGKEGSHLLLELGAGSALASLSAATLLHHRTPSPPTRLLATDVAETVETTLTENLDYNTLPRLPIGTSILPWGSLSPSQLATLLSPSPAPERLTILGADILYNPSSHSLLLDTLLSLLREGKEDRAFIAYKKRTEGDEGFFELVRGAGLRVERVWRWGEVGVWRFERGRE